MPTATPPDSRGHAYWQQQVDYSIAAALDEEEQRISATQTVTYHNNSPDTLTYLWLHLDQNRFRDDSIAEMSRTFEDPSPAVEGQDDTAQISLDNLRRLQYMNDEGPGVRNQRGEGRCGQADGPCNRRYPDAGGPTGAACHRRAGRIHRGIRLQHRARLRFPGARRLRALSRRCAHRRAITSSPSRSGSRAWPPTPTTRAGPTRNFSVPANSRWNSATMTWPSRFPQTTSFRATGELTNGGEVLTAEQQARLKQAETAEQPVFIVTPDEAPRERTRRRLRDRHLALQCEERARLRLGPRRASSSGDAQGNAASRARSRKQVMAMSFYPKEGGTLWSDYSTEVVIHALEVYSRFTFDYPWPTAQSVSVGFLGRHGIPDDHLQRPADHIAGRRITHLHPRRQALPHRRHHSRNRPFLLPDDRELRRAPVDLDGRGAEQLPRTPWPGENGTRRSAGRSSRAT